MLLCFSFETKSNFLGMQQIIENARRKLLDSKYGFSKGKMDDGNNKSSSPTPNFRMSLNPRHDEEIPFGCSTTESSDLCRYHFQPNGTNHQVFQEYVANLENECSVLKQMNCQLNSEVEVVLVNLKKGLGSEWISFAFEFSRNSNKKTK